MGRTHPHQRNRRARGRATGLTAALECLLSMDERPAEELIGEVRAGPTLTRRAARALRRPTRRSAS
jgi:hypothetical protein